MSITVVSGTNALAAGLSTYFLGTGGVGPYSYALQPLGAGGTINASTGKYSAPATVPIDPAKLYDVVVVTDSTSATATSSILIGTPLLLFCDILKHELNIADDHIYLWDQKIFQPVDSNLYIAVGILNSKPFGNSNFFDGATNSQIQSVNMLDTLSVDVMSRGPAARDRKGEVIMALNSQYAESQMEINCFGIGKLPAGGYFTNISNVDGAAIPYRFNISVNLQYFVKKVQSSQYYDEFLPAQIIVDP